MTVLIPAVVNLLGGAFYGFQFCILGGIIGSMLQCSWFDVNKISQSTLDAYQSIYMSSFTFGMIIGAGVGVRTADKFGRVKTLRYSGLFGVIFCTLNCIVNNFWLSTLIRICCGIVGGYFSTVCPLYSSEVVDPKKRGLVGGLVSFASAIGFIVAEVSNYIGVGGYFSLDKVKCISTWNWQVQFISIILDPLCLFILTFFIQESPCIILYLFKIDYIESGSKPSEKLPLLTSENESTAETTNTTVNTSESSTTGTTIITTTTVEQEIETSSSSLYSLKEWKNILLSIIIGSHLNCVGINSLITYVSFILYEIKIKDVLLYSIIVAGVISLIGTFLSSISMDYLGRRNTYMVGSIMMMVGVLCSSIAPYLLINIFTIISLVLVILGFQIGIGGSFFAWATEVFPLHVRSQACELSICLSWLSSCAMTYIFPYIMKLGLTTLFLLLLEIDLMYFVYMIRYLPETTGKALTDKK